MYLRIILVAIVFSFLTLGSGSATAAPSGPLHTFYGEVKAVDLAAKTITIKSHVRTFVFHITDETKISSQMDISGWTRSNGARERRL